VVADDVIVDVVVTNAVTIAEVADVVAVLMPRVVQDALATDLTEETDDHRKILETAAKEGAVRVYLKDQDAHDEKPNRFTSIFLTNLSRYHEEPKCLFRAFLVSNSC
jgi:hypothetical protein